MTWLRRLAVILGLLPAVALAEWSVELGRDATATVRYDGSRVLSFNYVAWGPNWKYADFKPTLGKGDGAAFPVKGEIKSLDTAVAGQAAWQDGKLVFDYTFTTSKGSENNIGGAINLTSRLSADLFGVKAIGVPTITDDKRGVTWTPLPGQTIAITFDNLARDCAFEKGKPQQVRAWVLPADLAAGERKVRMTIALPAGTTFKGMPSSRYADVDAATWLTKTVDWTASPVDLSYLNDKPAGSHGFVKADGEQFKIANGTARQILGLQRAGLRVVPGVGQGDRAAGQATGRARVQPRPHPPPRLGRLGHAERLRQGRHHHAAARRQRPRPHRLLGQVPERQRHLRLDGFTRRPTVPPRRRRARLRRIDAEQEDEQPPSQGLQLRQRPRHRADEAVREGLPDAHEQLHEHAVRRRAGGDGRADHERERHHRPLRPTVFEG